jgi:hypothetical protein
MRTAYSTRVRYLADCPYTAVYRLLRILPFLSVESGHFLGILPLAFLQAPFNRQL